MRLKGKLSLLALGLLGLLLLGQASLAQTVRLGNLVVTIEGEITPKALPRKEPAPITLSLEGSLKTADGTHPPALKTLFLRFDRHGHLNTEGLATCKASKLQSRLTAEAKRVCKDALVGTGRAEAQIALPEQAPFGASGQMLIFNGQPKGNKQVLVIHVYAFVPAPTTFVTTALIGKSTGKFGTTASVKIPTIVAGQGSLTGFNATLKKTWAHKGKRQDLLLASCPTGKLYADGEFSFADGTKLEGSVARSCTPKG